MTQGRNPQSYAEHPTSPASKLETLNNGQILINNASAMKESPRRAKSQYLVEQPAPILVHQRARTCL